MTNRKSTKRALLASVMALLLCFSMLLSTTFAWFTDSATSGRNTIQSGNLDVVLEYKTDWNDAWVEVNENTKLFKEGALYEPGYTEVVFLRVSNAGSLALKYNLNVKVYGETTSTNVNNQPFSLKDHLEIGYYYMDEYSSGANYADILMPFMFGTREAALTNVTTTKLSADTGIVCADSPVLVGTDTAKVIAIVLTMPTTVGNEANHKTGVAAPTIDLGVTLAATQYTDEDDSFGNQYDKDATYPTFVSNTAELQAAINSGASNIVMGPGEFSADLYTVSANKNLTLSGQGAATVLNFSKAQVNLALFDSLTISNCTIGRMLNKSWGQLVFSSSASAGVYTISNCIFNGIGTQGIYINQTVAGATYNILNCTFDGNFGGEGAITIQNDSSNHVDYTVNVTNCSFENIPASSHKIAILYTTYNGWTLNSPVAPNYVIP